MRHVILILFWGLTTTIQATTPSVSTDSIHTLKHVLKIHLSYPDSALRLLDTMEETNTAPLFLLQAQRAMLYGSHTNSCSYLFAKVKVIKEKEVCIV